MSNDSPEWLTQLRDEGKLGAAIKKARYEYEQGDRHEFSSLDDFLEKVKQAKVSMVSQRDNIAKQG